jgi:ABC-type enterochelin transport system permease subunit
METDMMNVVIAGALIVVACIVTATVVVWPEPYWLFRALLAYACFMFGAAIFLALFQAGKLRGD